MVTVICVLILLGIVGWCFSTPTSHGHLPPEPTDKEHRPPSKPPRR